MQASYILCSLVHVLEKYTLFFFNKHTYVEGRGGGGGGRFFRRGHESNRTFTVNIEFGT